MSEYVWPCPNYTMVSSPFGYRNGVFTPGAEFHKGVDLAAVLQFSLQRQVLC